MDKQYIYPLKEGWKQHAWYLVEVAFNENNPIFKALFYSGFLNGGAFNFKTKKYKNLIPGGYDHFAGATLDGNETINDVYYMKVIKVLLTEKEMQQDKYLLMPNEAIEIMEGKNGTN